MSLSAARRATEALRAAAGVSASLLARAPGRVNLIGEHVDYNGGFVLPAAIDRYVAAAAAPRHDAQLRVVAADRGESAMIDLGETRARGPGPREWVSYVHGVAAVLLEQGVPLTGGELAIAGDVPEGVGLSSSAALEVACATALLGLAGASLPPERIAALCQRAEVEWAGVACGIMDQFIAVFGRAGHALFLDCRSLAYEQIAIPDGIRLVITDSGIRRGLQSSSYNERVRACHEAASLLGVSQLRDISPEQFAAREAELPGQVRRRARYVVAEIERTRHAAESLREGDVRRVGTLMIESHAGLRDDYEVSTPELDMLVAAAMRVPGVYGSRLSGAGFGGCTVSLVADEMVERFAREVPAAFHRATGGRAAVYACQPAAGVSLERLTPLDV